MQINRLFEIIYILIDNKSVTAKQLAEHFEVSQRTIYRDIETLSLADIPVYMSKGKGGGISILDDFVLNKAVLTKQEKSDILSSIKTLNAINFNKTDSAIKKLSSLFGKGNQDWIEIDFSSWYNSKNESEIFDKLKSAILAKRIITFTYSSSKGEKTVRKVEPLKLYFKGMSRYLYCYCTLRKDFRFFKLSRMKDIVITENNFEREIIEPILKNKDIFDEKYIDLKLKISSDMAFRVYDEFDSYEKLDDGSFVGQIKYPLGKWLYNYIYSFGGSCEVLEPENIRKTVKNELQKTLEKYL